MPVFFGGRFLVAPTVASRVDDSALVNPNPAGGFGLALIGQSEGGEPGVALKFSDPARARQVLRSGKLLDALERAMHPSNDSDFPGAGTVTAIRVNPATKATLTLKDSTSADVIILNSSDWGRWNNQIKVKIENGTQVNTKKATVAYADQIVSKDNIGRNILSVQYTGVNATATITINDTSLSLAAGTGESFTANFSDYPTVQALYDFLATKSFLTVTLLADNAEHPTASALDFVSAQDVKTAAYTVTANLQALIDWFNSTEEPYVDATRATNAGKVPANTDGYVYLSGGSEGTIINQNWQDAFDVLKQQDVYVICPVTDEAAIHAMGDTHCQFMSGPSGKKERIQFVGATQGEQISDWITRAQGLNSDRTALVVQGVKDFDRNGSLVTFPPPLLAAQLAGMFASGGPGRALTNRYIVARGLDPLVKPEDRDTLLLAGIIPVEFVDGRGFKVVQSITTWIADTRYTRRELSTRWAADHTVRTVRESLEPLPGTTAGPQLIALAISRTESTLKRRAAEGIIVGDAENPAFKNIQAFIDGDVLSVSFEASPAIPANYILLTAHLVPYTSNTAA